MINDFLEDSPLDNLEREEYNEIVLKYCSLVCILKNKKMNFPSIFVCILEDDGLFSLYKRICGFENDREAVLEFLKFDESIVKSKFLKKVINQKDDSRRRT